MPSPLAPTTFATDVALQLDGLTRPQLQVAEALAALGSAVALAALTHVLVGSQSDQRVDDIVRQLCASELCRLEGAALVPAPGLRSALGRPLGLGPALSDVLAASYADHLRRIARHLGLPALGSKEVTLGLVTTHLLRPGVIEGVLAEAPDGVIDGMLDLAWCDEAAPAFEEDGDYRGAWDSRGLWPQRYREDSTWQPRAGYDHDVPWARDRGLIVSDRLDGHADLPAEVAMAVRGPDYRAPFDPERPVLRRPAPAQACPAGPVAGQLWLRLTRLCAALLHEAASKALPRRKSGALSAQEEARLAVALDATVEETRIVVALARSSRLLGASPSGVDERRLTAWLEAEVPERAAILARQLSASTPLLPVVPAPAPNGYSWSQPTTPPDITGMRRRLLAVLAELAPGESTQVEAVEHVLRWDAPRVTGRDSGALGAAWGEAVSLALVVDGLLSPIGRALLDPDESQLPAAFARVMPTVVNDVSLSADLTATAAGLPTRRVSRVLDAMADREREDASTVWRFSALSVRRAFDHGGSQGDILAGLTEISRTPIPQALTGLIGDIARRHGHLIVLPAGSIITSEDAALLAELRRSASLRGMRLQPLAPGILMATTAQEYTLELLRGVGYLPASAAVGTVRID